MMMATDSDKRSILAAAVERGNRDVLEALLSAIDARPNREVLHRATLFNW